MSATTLILLLLVLACPLSMLFMHRGRGHSHRPHDGAQRGADVGPEEGHAAHGGCGHGKGSRHEHAKGDTHT